ncbi:MAG: polyisoprenoid-binding protein [Deltaproteobacteria bacterium]|nr:polyisoprenoid-binding protein [Deltaproteobacteria bacterium]
MSANNWNIDGTHSGVNFSVRHMVFAKVRGRFGKFGGSLDLDPADLAKSSVDIQIDAASIDTGTPDRDNHLRSPDFFDVARYPQLTFKSKQVTRKGDTEYKVTGDLTIRDITREVVLDVEFGGTGKDPWGNQRLGFSASARIDRKDFGLKWNQVLEAGGVLVGEKIDIEIELQAVAKAESKVA